MSEMLTRVEAQEPQIAALLKVATARQRLEAALYACSATLEANASDDRLAADALRNIGSDKTISDLDIERLAAHAEDLDRQYWETRHGFEQRDEGTLAGWQAAYYRYLAVYSVSLFAEDQGPVGVGNALYDALGSLENSADARERVIALLGGDE